MIYEIIRMEAFIFEQPKKSTSLHVLETLEKRKRLNEFDRMELANQRKGHEGEHQFAALAKEILPDDVLVLYSITLKVGNSLFQIDCMIITHGEIYLIEVKNYYGDYLYHEEGFHLLKSEKRINNPLHQLQRCENLLRDFLTQFESKHKINPFTVFINQEFTIYEAPIDYKVIYPTQAKRFLLKIKENSAPATLEEKRLAKILMDNHIIHNPYEYTPRYRIRELRKGILCIHCSDLLRQKSRVQFICGKCGESESLSSLVLRNVVDFSILFPDLQITTNMIFEFLGEIISPKVIRSILRRHLIKKGRTRSTYFEFY